MKIFSKNENIYINLEAKITIKTLVYYVIY